MKMKYHFQCEKGWINDPNGLAYYSGKFHMFFQHNPYDIKWDTMHWGHAISDDLLSWEELPIALYPDQSYDNGLGCFSGSAIEHDGKLHILYTGVDKKKHQWQCKAIMTPDGEITKDKNNPLIRAPYGVNGKEFRDPKITAYKDKYLVVCGTGKGEYGKIVLYESKDLESFTYKGPIFKSKDYGRILECPDFFPLSDKWVLVMSVFVPGSSGTRFMVGSFDGDTFTIEQEYNLEHGPHFYAPQTFSHDGKRIIIGWLRDTYQKGERRNGCMTAPRELFFEDGRLKSYPIEIYHPLLTDTDKDIRVEDSCVYYKNEVIYTGRVEGVTMLRDEELLEVFINHGEENHIFFEK